MDTPSVDSHAPPAQSNRSSLPMVPDRMASIGPTWTSADGVNLDLYIDLKKGDGQLRAFPVAEQPAIAATITGANENIAFEWSGELDRPHVWEAAQERICRERYEQFKSGLRR